MDARADQLGMQKAGLKAGLKALSLESGKHCVYFHLDNDGVQIGAGRETMVHITSLTPDLRELTDLLSLWPLELVETLVANMEKAYAPQTKNIKAVEERIPTAAIVKQRIETKIEEAVKNGIQVLTLPNPDLSIITLNDTQLLVVKPDASGFVLSDASSELPAMVQLGHALGLQVITVYTDIAQTSKIHTLQNAMMQPAMVRLNQKKSGEKIVWQAGWRSTANRFNECLHSVNIDGEVLSQINNLISNI